MGADYLKSEQNSADNRLQRIFDSVRNNPDRKVDFFRDYNVSELFLERNIDKLDKRCWNEISDSQKLGELFIEKYKDEVNWTWICHSQVLGESFIDRHKEYVHWEWVALRQKISISFIVKHIDRLKLSHLQANTFVNNDDLAKIDFETLKRMAV